MKGEINLAIDFKSLDTPAIPSHENKGTSVHTSQYDVCDNCGYLVVSVSDTGVGIPQARLANLFQIFGTHT